MMEEEKEKEIILLKCISILQVDLFGQTFKKTGIE